MSFAGSRQCHCPRFSFNPSGRSAREWVVIQRNQNRSTYNGSAWLEEKGYGPRIQESRWSHVLCLTCGAHWRTQAQYVDRLPDIDEDLQPICFGKLRQGKRADPEFLAKLKPIFKDPRSNPRPIGRSAGRNLARRSDLARQLENLVKKGRKG